MGKKVDMIGKRFGRWKVLEEAARAKCGAVKYLCKCDCGKEKIVNGVSLRNGTSQSCGCYNRELITNPNKIYNTKLWAIWDNMKQRCYNSNNKAYKNYGGRGIKVCDEWKGSSFSFYNWAINNGYKEGLTLDRIDNEKDYCPQNCRWVTMAVQQNNKRTNRFFTYKGITKTIMQWSKDKNICYGTLIQRINNGKEPFAPIDLTKRHNYKGKQKLDENV